MDLSPIMTRSTNDLMIPITAMADHQVNLPLLITIGEYNAIAHLTYISAFTDLIEPYLAHVVTMEDEPPSLLQRMTSATPSPSHISVSSDEEETDHSGEEWMVYDGNNPKYYALIFINEWNEEEVTKYIRYVSVGDDMHLQGRRSKKTPLYAVSLHARPFSIANFWHSGLRDTDLAIFDPSSDDCLVIDNALFYLRDVGVIADVHTLRAQYTRLANMKRQRVELNNIERKAEKKKNTIEQYLAHAAVQTHLYCYVRKSSGPLFFIFSSRPYPLPPRHCTHPIPNLACYSFCLVLLRHASCTISRAMSRHRPALTRLVFPTFPRLPYLPS
jgi:hypothetical protein